MLTFGTSGGLFWGMERGLSQNDWREKLKSFNISISKIFKDAWRPWSAGPYSPALRTWTSLGGHS